MVAGLKIRACAVRVRESSVVLEGPNLVLPTPSSHAPTRRIIPCSLPRSSGGDVPQSRRATDKFFSSETCGARGWTSDLKLGVPIQSHQGHVAGISAPLQLLATIINFVLTATSPKPFRGVISDRTRQRSCGDRSGPRACTGCRGGPASAVGLVESPTRSTTLRSARLSAYPRREPTLPRSAIICHTLLVAGKVQSGRLVSGG
jgi:hypothetical protein